MTTLTYFIGKDCTSLGSIVVKQCNGQTYQREVCHVRVRKRKRCVKDLEQQKKKKSLLKPYISIKVQHRRLDACFPGSVNSGLSKASKAAL